MNKPQLLGRKELMGITEIGLFLMIFSHHCLVAPASLLHKASPSEFMQETTIEYEGANGHGSNGSDDDSDNSRSRIAHSTKLEHGYSHGSVNGGVSTTIGENGNNGGTRSPNTQGSTFTPVYAAGSVNNRHHNNHHGAANSNKKCIGLATLFASSWASLVHLYMVF